MLIITLPKLLERPNYKEYRGFKFLPSERGLESGDRRDRPRHSSIVDPIRLPIIKARDV